MNSNTQVFSDFGTTFRTLLRSPKSINFTKELSTLPAHILDDGSELTERPVKHMFPKHPFGTDAIVQVFHEDHITNITKSMSLFVVKVFSGVVNPVMKSCNNDALFLVIFRPFLFSREPMLQQFQLALQAFKKLGRFYENTITGCQKLFQTDIYPNRMTVGHWVWNADITLKTNGGIPAVGFPQDSYLLYHKTVGDWSMQVNWNCSNLGQLDLQVAHWILFELRKKQRLQLSILLESGKPKSSLLKVLPASMQLLNSLLENLGRNFTQPWKSNLCFGQVVKLTDFTRKLQVSRQDVLFFKRASINQALATIAPILNLSKRIVECTTADFHPLNECLFLSGIGIDSIAVRKYQHPSIIQALLAGCDTLNVKRGDIESPFLTASHPAAKLLGVLALRLDKRKFPRDPEELPLETITRWDFPALGKISYMTTIDETLTWRRFQPILS
jgi:hypothetical protein